MLPEGQSSFLLTHVGDSQLPVIPDPVNLMSSCLHRQLHTYMCIYAHRKQWDRDVGNLSNNISGRYVVWLKVAGTAGIDGAYSVQFSQSSIGLSGEEESQHTQKEAFQVEGTMVGFPHTGADRTLFYLKGSLDFPFENLMIMCE